MRSRKKKGQQPKDGGISETELFESYIVNIKNNNLFFLDDNIYKTFKSKEKINMKDENGKTALMYAIETKNVELVQYLLIYSDLSQVDNNGRTELMYACANSAIDPKSFRTYLYVKTSSVIHPSNIYTRDKKGKNALQIAEENNNAEIVKDLKANFIGLLPQVPLIADGSNKKKKKSRSRKKRVVSLRS